MAKMRKACIFCGGQPLSGEHVFAEWMQAYIPFGRNGYESFTEKIGVNGETASIKRHPGDPKSRKIRRVCVTCNTQWMSKIQNDTKPFLVPLLLGQNVSLHKREQALIATWATMFTMVAEWFHANPDLVSISSQQCLTFKQTKRPPKGWKVWIASLSNESNGSLSRSTVPVSAPDKMPEIAADGHDIPNTQTTTILIGRLLIHTFSSVHAGLVRQKRLPRLTQIWPVVSSPLSSRALIKVGPETADAVAEWLPVRGRQKAADLLRNSR